jgi:aldose 1-epimerase
MRDGVLRWGGHDYLFPHTEGPHAIHGMVRRRPWTVAEHSASEVVLVQELARPWPFPGRVTQSIALGDDSATFRMMVDPDHCSIGEMTWNRRGLAGPLGTTAVTS